VSSIYPPLLVGWSENPDFRRCLVVLRMAIVSRLRRVAAGRPAAAWQRLVLVECSEIWLMALPESWASLHGLLEAEAWCCQSDSQLEQGHNFRLVEAAPLVSSQEKPSCSNAERPNLSLFRSVMCPLLSAKVVLQG
jgi:hypothetical protein